MCPPWRRAGTSASPRPTGEMAQWPGDSGCGGRKGSQTEIVPGLPTGHCPLGTKQHMDAAPLPMAVNCVVFVLDWEQSWETVTITK